jgi:hypothetical protein
MATYTLISSNVLTASAASVTFSSIPATYTDLVLRISARSSTFQQAVDVTFNGDTPASGTSYSFVYLRGNGSAASSSLTGSTSSVNVVGGQDQSNYTANTFSNFEFYIPNYNSTSNKPVSSFTAAENNNATTWFINTVAGLYRNATALTSILLTPTSGNFASTSSFYLYGISNA